MFGLLAEGVGGREKHDVEISGWDGKLFETTVITYSWTDAPAARTPPPIGANATTTIEHDDDGGLNRGMFNTDRRPLVGVKQ